MKQSKQEVIDSILILAKHVGLENNFKHLIDYYPGIPKIVEMIVYQLFIHKFIYTHCTDEVYEAYETILTFAQELQNIGWVEFEK
jgi:hypothetical protein